LIVIPLSKPIIATLSLFYAVGRWNAYSDNMYYIKTDSLKLIQYKLYQLVSGAEASISASLGDTGGVSNTMTPEVLQAACIMFVTIPIIIIYPFLQKYFVQGAMVGAVKG
ncbi:MAG: carbohydrate ABC transporter permease, partial [Pseudobutyrivibrio sp.]|nr:carbohydrate ABC transporter permease [Pseudobutyrivibrio sp.]